MIRDEWRLNSMALKNRIKELQVKQSWIAKKVGVDPKTVIRWTQGQVKSIQKQNAEALAQVLQCSSQDFCLPDPADQLATTQDQKIAAELLQKSSVVSKLGPLGEWNVIESLLKATLVPNLSLPVLGDLYNQLTVAAWRQSKMSDAEIYNRKALEIADKIQDSAILAAALLSAANLRSWAGLTDEAIDLYRKCFALHDSIPAKTLAAAHSNLGAVLFESGRHQEAHEFQLKALELFQSCGQPMNLSICWTHMALLFLETGEFEKAAQANQQALVFAQEDSYQRGLLFGSLVETELEVRKGQTEFALQKLTDTLKGFSKLSIEEPLNFEFAGRICRLLGELQMSLSYLQRGIDLAATHPLAQSKLQKELELTNAVLAHLDVT